MPLFETFPVDVEQVKTIVAEHWNLELGKQLKSSQNHTFESTLRSDPSVHYAVRVTPDPKNTHWQRIVDEVFFVDYVARSPLVSDSVCRPVASSKTNELALRVGDLTFVVSTWAKGSPLAFMEFKWMTDETIVRAWGRFFANLHRVSRAFSKEHPERANRIQRWDEVHDKVMAGSKLHPDDEALQQPGVPHGLHYGIIHGDINCSNFFWQEEAKLLSVFDWDQTQQGWYLFDVAQACLTSVMLFEAGSLVDGSRIPEANPDQFRRWIMEGYSEATPEEEGRAQLVNEERLLRMIDIRKAFYAKFCLRAQKEGGMSPEMQYFVKHIVDWVTKYPPKDI